MLRSGIVYVPASPVFVAAWIPVPSFNMTSSALGTTCPLESVTVPVMVPRSPCAKRPAAVKPDKTNHRNRFRVMISTSSPPVYHKSERQLSLQNEDPRADMSPDSA